MRRFAGLLALSLLVAGCPATGDTVISDVTGDISDGRATETVADVETPPDSMLPDAIGAEDAMELVFPDVVEDFIGPACNPGEGCFLDKCSENSQCLSGWCVEHMGEGVCTMQCTEECPAGWSCQQVAGTAPDVVFVCVSDAANLCRPCANGDNCKSPAGSEDVCVDYGPEGNFCGSACATDDDCPWGFSCSQAVTVDGIDTKQCVADAGVCPCTEKSVALALWTPCSISNEAGMCAGKRVCTAAGLADCDAASPDAEACDGADNDCDGDVDEPDLVDGKYVELCDDGNACTLDSCLGADGCSHEDLGGGECGDGDACTVGDHCEAGQCVGLPVACDDGNPCTDDFCDGFGGCSAQFNLADCDDGDPCTVQDSCLDGECSGYAVSCECQVDADCGALEDGDLCNGTLVCNTDKLPHLCVIDPTTVVDCPPPADGPDAFCQAAQCNPDTGACSIVSDHEGMACNDGDLCSIGESCQQGTCGNGADLNCNDGNGCTDDLCDPQTGCQHTFNDDSCSDGNACTVGDVCNAGGCDPGPAAQCNDNNPCTDDSCDPLAGCVHVANQAQCDLGNACTEGDHCENGSCVFDSFVDCDDGNICTTDSCAPDSGCVYALNALPCTDNDACTTGDFCHLGECVAGGQLTCNDANPCTDDSCDAQSGCKFIPNNQPCDDGSLCTTDDHCSLGWCKATGVLNCNDDNPCTDDSCDPELGCQFVANQQPCDDENACTVGDQCQQGACQSGGPLDCDDKAFCNGLETCDPETGCLAGDPPPLDDGVECTDDVCDEEGDKVVHAPNNAACDDDLYCNGVETCDVVLNCLPGSPPLLDDGVGCTVDSCDEMDDIVHHVADDGLCNDGNPCNGVETCDPVIDCQGGVPQNCFFDEANHKILLANNIFIKCFGGLTVTPAMVSCEKPLFNQENYSTNLNQNTMMGLHNEGEAYAAGHKYILEEIGTYVGYAGSRTVKMNEGGLDNMWIGTGTYENEHCYANGQLLNWKQNVVCNNGLGGGSNVLSSFTLSK